MDMHEYLQKRIEYLRRKMMQIATHKGLTDTESVKISQELDIVLNHYEKMKKQANKHSM
ncbi:aspartyl-phosphate phosphatase Spo0E family protein [Oceanobacillus chungangensis]|uniref:Spo0E family sporulation regulatory protein-aspartic acid phosphatase n=1 Tax=Oceanobacillus chungangensis TaxID=1229152 RepID=A0A3D8PQX5_9BACI|nr:aspartyl-phosphate phosphatase Spo0E family protein [Oceanobacillus chungangensis]RDW17987.1 Spo0E family sporulation regulatory protein-aspartic acid phosphatase [Oceanobacillus chungangensis]